MSHDNYRQYIYSINGNSFVNLCIDTKRFKGEEMIMKLLRWNKSVRQLQNMFGSDFKENCRRNFK